MVKPQRILTANHFILIVLGKHRKDWKLQSVLKRLNNPKSTDVCVYGHSTGQGHRTRSPVPKGALWYLPGSGPLLAGQIQKSHLLWCEGLCCQENGRVLGPWVELVLFTEEWLGSQLRERQRSRPLFLKKSLGCLTKLTLVHIVRTNISAKLCWGTDFREVKISQAPKTVEFRQCIFILSFLSFWNNPSLKSHWSLPSF